MGEEVIEDGYLDSASFNVMPAPTFKVNQNSEIVLWNNAMVSLTGRSRQAVIGQSVHDILFRGESNNPITMAMTAAMDVNSKHEIPVGDLGAPRAVEMFLVPILGAEAATPMGLIGNLTPCVEASALPEAETGALDEVDIEEEAPEPEDIFPLERFIDELGSPAIFCDPTGLITHINQKASSGLLALGRGYVDLSAYLGRPIMSFLPVPRLMSLTLPTTARAVFVGESCLDIHTAPVEVDGEVCGYCITFSDVSALSEMVAQCEHLQHNLDCVEGVIRAWSEGDVFSSQNQKELEIPAELAACFTDFGRTFGQFEVELKCLSGQIGKGDLDARAKGKGLPGIFSKFIEMTNGMLNAIIEPIHDVRTQLETISDGDLTAYGDKEYVGDHGLLQQTVNLTLDSLNRVLSDITRSVDKVAKDSEEIQSTSKGLSQGTSIQASTVEEITAQMTQMAEATKGNAENAAEASRLAGEAREGADKGDAHMSDMVTAMQEIDEASQNISKIIKVIDEIAFQTNLLALNAAVEAARAGVHGKGFAVVAEEVRNLAARSARAAKETTEMIEGSMKKVSLGMSIARDTAEALDAIVSSITKVTDLVSEIATASNEQAQGIAQINDGLGQVNEVTQKNSTKSEISAKAAETLTGEAHKLEELLSHFELRVGPDSVDGLPPGITPEILAALTAYMKTGLSDMSAANQGLKTAAPMPKGGPAPSTWGQQAGVTPAGLPAQRQGVSPAPVPVTNMSIGSDDLSLNDGDFGKY